MEEDKRDADKDEAKEMDVDKEEVKESNKIEEKAEDDKVANKIAKEGEEEVAKEVPKEGEKEVAKEDERSSNSEEVAKEGEKEVAEEGAEEGEKEEEKEELMLTKKAGNCGEDGNEELKSEEMEEESEEKTNKAEDKGRGTALKDIPNGTVSSNSVALYVIHILHMDIQPLPCNVQWAAQVKSNISRFSGFVWHDNEEKQMIKVKEKLDKCVKEKLVEFCDVLDIPISKANTRKEDIIAKLIEFLVEPHASSSDLIAEKKSRGKRERGVSKSASGSSTPSKDQRRQLKKNLSVDMLKLMFETLQVKFCYLCVWHSQNQKKAESASKKSGETKSSPPESEDESEEEKVEDVNGVQEKSDDEMSEQAESEEKGSESEGESDEDKEKQKRGSAKSSAKKESSGKAKTKKVTISKKTSPPPKKTPAKPPPSRSKSNNDTSAKKSSGKKKGEQIEKSSTPKKSASKESTGEDHICSPFISCPLNLSTGRLKKVLKVKEKLKEEILKPSDDKLRTVICEILKEVDFNTDELTKLADADEADDEEDEGDVEKDEKKASSVDVKG
ncbi:hypothetical protein Sango_2560900 [Sesamum angolense]|uniref:Uncharacterized protein n=1 Tax=Sesamum angolense TaxID=2727404 RepID=A0AAE1W4Y7_9LAMI|nr:hypothetical protein Sango_2560900 [Sesamum angolense]